MPVICVVKGKKTGGKVALEKIVSLNGSVCVRRGGSRRMKNVTPVRNEFIRWEEIYRNAGFYRERMLLK